MIGGKKALLALTLALLVAQASAGADTLLFQQFTDTVFPPSGWTGYNFDGGEQWKRFTNYSNSPPACAGCLYGSASNDWLIASRTQTLSADDSLIFYYRAQSAGFTETLLVRVSTDSVVSDTTRYSVADLIVTNSPTWQRRSLSLAAFAGSQAYVAFHYVSHDRFAIAIDDVALVRFTLPAKDVGVEAIVSPGSTFPPNTQMIPRARVKNYGTMSQSSFPVVCSIVGEHGMQRYVAAETIATLASGDTITVDFVSWTPTVLELCSVKMATKLAGDENPANDRKTRATQIARFPPFYAGGSGPGVVYSYDGSQTTVISPVLGFAVLCLCEYNGQLYAGTMSDSNPREGVGRVYRYDGSQWSQVGGDLDNQVACLVVFREELYAGTAWNRGRLYRLDSGGNSWTMAIDHQDPGGWKGFRCGYVWNDNLYLGDIAFDLIGRYDGAGFQHITGSGGCCIYDFQWYEDALYASAWKGILLRSPEGQTWTQVVGNQGIDMHTWALGVFRDTLFMATGKHLQKLSGTRAVNEWTAPDHIISLVECGNLLLLGTGRDAGSSYGVAGAGRVYAYDGDSAKCFPDSFGTGIQTILLNCTHDVAVSRILAPLGRIPPDTTLLPRAVVGNLGRVTETFLVCFRIGRDSLSPQTVTLAAGQLDTVTFAPWQTTQRGTFVVACSTMLDGDEYLGNDKSTGSVTVDSGGGVQVNSVSADRGGTGGWLLLDIRGSGFEAGAEASLLGTTDGPIVSYWTEFVSSQQVTALFNLCGAGIGGRSVMVRNPSGGVGVFYDALTLDGMREAFWLDIIGLDQLRVGREQEYQIVCGNQGNNDAQVAVRLSLPQSVNVRIPGVDPATGTGGFFATLPAGTRATMSAYLLAEAPGPDIVIEAGGSCLPFPGPPLPVPSPPGPLDPYVGFMYTPTVAVFRDNGFAIDKDPPTLWDVLAKAFSDMLKPSMRSKIETSIEVTHGITEYIITWSGELGVQFPDPQYIMSVKPKEIDVECSNAVDVRVRAKKRISIVGSVDPNDKAGPAGFGDARFAPPYEQFQYVIYFENVDTATAPAEDVVITDTLDSDLDWTTFAVDTSSHAISSTNFDPATGVVTWRFEDINLPPNRTPPEGEGWLSYTINPKPGLTTGTEIRNRAWIVFDVNAPMATREVLNTIDAGPPSSSVAQLPEDEPLTSFAVQLAGSDDDGGSGIRSYDVYVSDNDSGFAFWKSTESTSVAYTGVNGHTYKFYSRASDNVGQVEGSKTQPEATTAIRLPTGVEVSPNPFVPSRGHTVISFFGAGLSEAEIKVFNKAGELVKKLTGEKDKDRLDWDAKNENGKELASGVYIYVVKEKSGTVRKGKFAIIR
ncbi:MAG: choice-of-anchor J domain-containing protein [candidate division WOR-3 bacterium]|nr:choice-of-anchor J domain-containing protein [candidate division WOR-3 bacterium]